MGGFVLVESAHSMQGLFYGGCSRSAGLRMEQLMLESQNPNTSALVAEVYLSAVTDNCPCRAG